MDEQEWRIVGAVLVGLLTGVVLAVVAVMYVFGLPT